MTGRIPGIRRNVLEWSPTTRLDKTIPGGSPLYKRVKRIGNQWTQYYSSDGINWTVAGTFMHTLTVRSWHIRCKCRVAGPAFTALVDYFKHQCACARSRAARQLATSR